MNSRGGNGFGHIASARGFRARIVPPIAGGGARSSEDRAGLPTSSAEEASSQCAVSNHHREYDREPSPKRAKTIKLLELLHGNPSPADLRQLPTINAVLPHTSGTIPSRRRRSSCNDNRARQTRGPDAGMPFTGDFSGCSWNSQALFARRCHRQHPKMRHAIRLAQSHDFTGFQETHSQPGRVEAFRLPPNMCAFWSHGTTTQAGIGLLVQRSFLDNFNPVVESDWEQIEPGRVAVLRLRGPCGGIDLFVVYMASGEDAAVSRAASICKIATSIGSRTEVLTILAGDFNFVPREKDRFSKSTCEWTGDKDTKDAEEFSRLVTLPFQMHELEQMQFTHDNAQSRSRIDRVYINNHVADQLDRHYSCAAMAWVKGLSAHRPISFSRCKRGKHEAVATPIPTAPMDDPEWHERVALRFGELIRSDDKSSDALRRLTLLKQAIRDVALALGKQQQHNAAKTKEDKLGWTMASLRASEDVRLTVMEKCTLVYPHLAELVDY